MADTKRINAKELMAFDVHVHIEHTEDATATDDASTKYFAAENADVAIAFASIDPTRGPEAVREARRLVEAGVERALKLQNETVFFDFLDSSSPERR